MSLKLDHSARFLNGFVCHFFTSTIQGLPCITFKAKIITRFLTLKSPFRETLYLGKLEGFYKSKNVGALIERALICLCIFCCRVWKSTIRSWLRWRENWNHARLRWTRRTSRYNKRVFLLWRHSWNTQRIMNYYRSIWLVVGAPLSEIFSRGISTATLLINESFFVALTLVRSHFFPSTNLA